MLQGLMAGDGDKARCGDGVVGGMVAPTTSQSLEPENNTLYSKRCNYVKGFAGSFPGLLGWTLNVITCIVIGERQKKFETDAQRR